MMWFFAIAGIAISGIAYLIYLYNLLIKKKFLLEEAWSGIDVQLKRRHDLIPMLVEVVKGYASHESDTLTEVVELRSQLDHEENLPRREAGEKQLSGKVSKLFALAEAYPDLKADKNFREFQSQLTEVEDDLQYARRYYNGTVRDFNVLVLSFPSNLVASFMRYEQRKFFEVQYVTERNVPDVEFS